MKIHSNHLKSIQEIINKLFYLKFPKIQNLIQYFKIEDIHFYFNMICFEVFQLVLSEK